MFFTTREEAGRELTKRVSNYANSKDTIVVALPRGGVPVGFEIAKTLNLPLTLFFTKKIPSPFNKEFAIGAVSENGLYQVNESILSRLDIPEEYINKSIKNILDKINKKKKTYNIRQTDFSNKTVLLVDDGIATGSSIYLAAKSLIHEGAKEVIILSPVAPDDIQNTICKEFKCIVLYYDSNLIAVGRFYEDFHQLEDKEVLDILHKKYLQN